MTLTRDQATSLIYGEQYYAFIQHGDDQHTPLEWLTFIRSYAERAINRESFNETGDPCNALRIIGALALTALQQHGASVRVERKLERMVPVDTIEHWRQLALATCYALEQLPCSTQQTELSMIANRVPQAIQAVLFPSP